MTISANKQERKVGKVGFRKLILWNSSSCSVALSTLVLDYATFYCTDGLQLSPALVGTLFMVSKMFDSVTDVLAGFIVDRTQTRWGKGRPYEIFMLFLWFSTWLLFSCPTSFATTAKCIWIFCMRKKFWYGAYVYHWYPGWLCWLRAHILCRQQYGGLYCGRCFCRCGFCSH